jgi:CheY-like chemotaxis protein
LKVLVIDDDSTVLEVVSGTLQDMGHEAATRTSAIGASAWILQERPDLVLVDLNMPVLPGKEWLTLVTQVGLVTGDGYSPHFVVLSSRSIEDLESIVRDTCAIGYIQKQDGVDAFEAAFEKIVQGLEP